MPSTGVPELRRSATSASSSSSRTRRIAAGKAPTPGRMTPSAARTARGSLVIEASAPTRSSAFSTERRLPIP